MARNRKPELPDGFSARAAAPDDVGDVARLVMATDWAGFFEADTVEDELSDDWRGMALDFERDSWLVFSPDGDLAASAELFHWGHSRIEVSAAVHPEYSGRGIGSFLISATGGRSGEHVPLAPPEKRVVLHRPVNAANEEARKLLESTGHALARNFWTMEIELGGNPALPAWPEGISVRTCFRGRDERAVYEAQREAFRDHWGGNEEPFEEWSRRMAEGPGYDPSLWFITENEGEVAGMSLCRSTSEAKGWVAVLGVRRGWRRRGLGEALLLHSFGEMRRRGKTSVELGVDSESLTGATRLYERAGMKVARQVAVFEKELRPEGRGVGGGGSGKTRH